MAVDTGQGYIYEYEFHYWHSYLLSLSSSLCGGVEHDAIKIVSLVLNKIGRSEHDREHIQLKCQRHSDNIKKQNQPKTLVKMSDT